MRVLFSSTFGYGHMFPMYPLARAFLAAGHDVLWATSADAGERLEAAGLPAAPSGLAGAELRERVGSLQARVASVSPRERAAFMYPRLFGETLTPPMAADLLPLATRWRPDLMVHEHGELASPLVGAVLQVPSVTHAFGGGIPPSMLEDAGARLAGLWAEHGQALPPYAGSFTTLYLDICPPSVQSVPLDHVPARQPLRPVADTGGASGPLPHYLERDERPLVYVTLGTVQNRLPLLAPAVAAPSPGCPSGSSSPSAPTATRTLSDLSPTTSTSSGGSTSRASCSTATWWSPTRGRAPSSAPSPRACPSCACPRPPTSSATPRAAARAGVAVVLRPDESSPEAIASAVGALLTDEALRRRARGVADEIAAMPSPGDVVDKLVTTFGGGA